MKVITLDHNGKAELKDIANELDSLRSELGGGWLELIAVAEGVSAYIDEDGKSKNLPRNYQATTIVESGLASIGRRLLPGDFISGKIIFMNSEDDADIPAWFVKRWFPNLL